jgi:hypothetical protein
MAAMPIVTLNAFTDGLPEQRQAMLSPLLFDDPMHRLSLSWDQSGGDTRESCQAGVKDL